MLHYRTYAYRTYAYRRDGYLTSLTEGDATTHYTVDPIGRITQAQATTPGGAPPATSSPPTGPNPPPAGNGRALKDSSAKTYGANGSLRKPPIRG